MHCLINACIYSRSLHRPILWIPCTRAETARAKYKCSSRADCSIGKQTTSKHSLTATSFGCRMLLSQLLCWPALDNQPALDYQDVTRARGTRDEKDQEFRATNEQTRPTTRGHCGANGAFSWHLYWKWASDIKKNVLKLCIVMNGSAGSIKKDV